MGRPLKKGLDYFSLDCHIDDKLKFIISCFGMKGFAIVIRIWQKIYGEEGYFAYWSQDVALMFAFENGCGVNVVNEVVESCLNRDIFSREMFDKHGILTSKGIQKRYLEATKRRENSKIEDRYLLLNAPKKSKKQVNANNNPIIADSKYTKESKVNKNKYIYAFPLKDGTTYEVNENDILLWERTYKNINVRDELLCIISWVDSNPSKRKTRAGAKKFINGWLNKNNSERKPKEVKQHEYPRL